LPFAIPLDVLLTSTILYFPLYPIGYMIESDFPKLMTAVLSGCCSYALLQFDLQGKFMPVFFKDLLEYLFRPKSTNFNGDKIHRFNKHRAQWEMGEVILNEIPFNSL